MKILILSFFITATLWSTALADGIFVEAGPGVFKSGGSTAELVRYQLDTRIFSHEGYYEGVFAHWDNKERANVIGIAPGLRWTTSRGRYWSGSFGLAYLNRETDHLGTHFQFYIRFAYGLRLRHLDFSLGLVHISNGKLIFGWKGPNSGENFVTFSVGLF